MTDTLPKSKVYLSRRNLLALLSKLDREAAGEQTACTIIKYKNAGDKFKKDTCYQQTMESIMVVAVQDEKYYAAENRQAGVMHESDEVKLPKPEQGISVGSNIFFGT